MSDKLKTLRTNYSSKLAAARQLLDSSKDENGLVPPDIATKVDGILGDADVIMAQIKQEERLTNALETGQSPAPTAAASVDWRMAGPTEGDMEYDEKSWRELEVKTPRGDVTVRYNVPLVVQNDQYRGAFERYVRHGKTSLTPAELKALSAGVDSAGGFTIPEDFQVQMLKKMAALAVFRQFARVVTTSRDRVKWPRIPYTTDDKYTSPVRMTWTGEVPASSTVHRVTDPTFGLVDIPVHTAMASMPMYNDLIEDSALDMVGLCTDLLSEAFALGEENVFWNGTGVNQPMGVLGQVDVASVGPTSVITGSASAMTADGLIDLIYALPEQYEIGSRVFWNKATEKAIRKLKINATDNEYVWPAEERVGGFGVADPTILGYPITRAAFLPDVGAGTYPVVFGQLTGYIIVDRVGVSIARLEELYAEQNTTLLLARRRVGGSLAEPWRMRVQKVSA